MEFLSLYVHIVKITLNKAPVIFRRKSCIRIVNDLSKIIQSVKCYPSFTSRTIAKTSSTKKDKSEHLMVACWKWLQNSLISLKHNYARP